MKWQAVKSEPAWPLSLSPAPPSPLTLTLLSLFLRIFSLIFSSFWFDIGNISGNKEASALRPKSWKQNKSFVAPHGPRPPALESAQRSRYESGCQVQSCSAAPRVAARAASSPLFLPLPTCQVGVHCFYSYMAGTQDKAVTKTDNASVLIDLTF